MFIVYEIVLTPLLYFKVMYHTFKQTCSAPTNLITLIFIWLPFGILILFYILLADIVRLMKALSDFKIGDDVESKKIEIYFRQDSIVIYNEMKVTLQLIMDTYRCYEMEKDKVLK